MYTFRVSSDGASPDNQPRMEFSSTERTEGTSPDAELVTIFSYCSPISFDSMSSICAMPSIYTPLLLSID